ncbi:potassium channel family protein [Pontibacter pamirensis]|uniref:potassium channel family protein n=1 Tax=Pontibacter pamirensis TaxID=2562824 RepID=UPI00138A3727|nr:potassium channel family protein [Pontibacter pamirensis]
MDILLLLLGIAVVFWSIVEAFWTIIWIVGDSAPITSRFTTVTWRLFRTIFSKKQHRILSLAGPLILFFSILLWLLFLWLGWTLIFYADLSSIASTRSNVTPDFTDVLWYIAYCLFTIGNGDFTPNGDAWQVLSSLVGLNGMLMITLSVTYFLQVVSAVVNKRSFASQVTSVGSTPEEFVLKFWNGRDFKDMEFQLSSLSQQLATLNEQHMAFPILHYYRTTSNQKSQGRAIAILYDALLLLEHGVEECARPSQAYLHSALESGKSFLSTLKTAFIDKAEELPPHPSLSRLYNKGVPTLPEQEFYQRLEKEKDNRKLILGLIQNNVRQWPS